MSLSTTFSHVAFDDVNNLVVVDASAGMPLYERLVTFTLQVWHELEPTNVSDVFEFALTELDCSIRFQDVAQEAVTWYANTQALLQYNFILNSASPSLCL